MFYCLFIVSFGYICKNHKLLIMKKFIKEAISSFLLFFFTYTVTAQPNLVKLDNHFLYGDGNELLVLSDVGNPIENGKTRKLVSNITIGSKGVWSRYSFEDGTTEGQWYKNFTFLKVVKPLDFRYPTDRSLYDTANKLFVDYPQISNKKQYIHLIDTKSVKDDFKFSFDYSIDSNIYLNIYKNKKNNYYFTINQEDGNNFIYLENTTEPNKFVTPSVYKFTNADFINEDVTDKSVNTKANYLFLQRDYKLGNTYNTVAFPIDVSLKDYNHIYNNGTNRLEVYRLDAIDDNNLNFVRDISEVLLANTPYIIKSQNSDNTSPDEKVSEYYLNDEPVDTFEINKTKELMSQNGIKIYAQYKQNIVLQNSDLNPDEDVYIVSNNKLVNCRNIKEASVKRFRWYLKRPYKQDPTPITFTFDGTTVVESVEMEENHNSNGIYNLSGQKCTNGNDTSMLNKGYYVKDGKVVLIGD